MIGIARCTRKRDSMTGKIGWMSAGLIGALLLSGCAAAQQPTNEAGTAEGCKGTVIGDSIPQASDPGLDVIRQGFVGEATAQGAEVLTADANLDVNKQLSDVDGFVQRGVDAVVAWPMDSTALRPALQRAADAGAAVVTHQTVGGISASTNVQFDDRAAGVALATYLAEKLGKGAKVAMISGPQQVDLFRNLAEGFEEGAKAASLDLVETQENAELAPQKSAEITEQLRTRYGSELAGIFDTLNVTALATATVRGEGFEPVVVTYQGNEETNQAIADGRLTATVDVANILVGRSAAWVVCQRLERKELPATVQVPFFVVDADNVGDVQTDADLLKADVTFSVEKTDSGDRIAYSGVDLPKSAVSGTAGD